MNPPRMSGEKTCSRCLETKHVLAFGLHSESADGLRAQCRDCRNELERLRLHRKSRKKGLRSAKQMKFLSVKRVEGG